MKKTCLLMLGLIISATSFAKDNTVKIPTDSAPQIRLVATANQKVKLFIQPQQTSILLVLKDSEGHLLYKSSSLNIKKGLSRQFDLSDLETGTYQLLIATETETLTKTFVVRPASGQPMVVLI